MYAPRPGITLIGISVYGIVGGHGDVAVDQLPLTVPVFQILLSLVDQDFHGYALIRDIEQRTGGEVRLTASTFMARSPACLMPCCIEELDAEPGLERRRRYRLTRLGRSLIRREAERLERAAGWARDKRLLSHGRR